MDKGKLYSPLLKRVITMNLKRIGTLLLITAILTIDYVDAKKLGDDIISEVKNYIKEGRYECPLDEAIAELSKIIDKNPQNAEAYYLRGRTYVAKIDDLNSSRDPGFAKHVPSAWSDQAIADFTKTIEIDPQYIDAYLYRGIWTESLSDFNKAIELNPNNAKAYYYRACYAKRKGDTNRDIADLTKAIEIDPNYAAAYFERGMVYRSKDLNNQAISDFSKAIEINPNFTEAYEWRAWAYYDKKEYDKSWKDVYKAEELGGFAVIRTNLENPEKPPTRWIKK